MAEEFSVCYDGDTGQVVLDGLPTGAAGGAALTPAHDLEFIFDRADGHLARVVIGPEEPAGPIAIGPSAAALLTGMFGEEVLAVVGAVEGRRTVPRALLSDTRISAPLSRLARLDAARATSPARSTSPLWAAEAAQLARRGGLSARARAEARRAVSGLAHVLIDAPRTEALVRAASAVADLAEADEPERAKQLREVVARSVAISGQQRLAEPAGPAGRGGGAPGHDLAVGAVNLGLRCSLDPDVVPAGVFLLGLSPVSDLSVRSSGCPDRVIVEAMLRPEADREALGRCRVRLVDPAIRRVLSVASFAAAEGSRLRAELPVPFPWAELRGTAWVEVVDDERRPVRSERLRQLRLALRWADAALRAELRPVGLAAGLAEEEWAGLAASAWDRCRSYWDRAGDPARAYLASMRLAALGSDAAGMAAPSPWAEALGERRPPREAPFLAEALGF